MTSFRSRPSLILRSGLTLVEIMIALTMTLIVLGAMMTAFQYASQQMQMGRGVMEMANRLRSAEEFMREDLSNLTVDTRPYTESTHPNGYFEIVEGPRIDRTSGTIPGLNYLGDLDDVWMGTVRSQGTPFRGRYISTKRIMPPIPPITVGPSGIEQTILPTFETKVIESPIAEIVWWTDYVDRSSPNNFAVDFVGDSITIFRRVLLIRPDLNDGFNLPTFTQFGAAVSYLATNDISARIQAIDDSGTTLYKIIANSIDELSHRQVRFCHNPVLGPAPGVAPAPAAFPHHLHRNSLWLTRASDYSPGGSIDMIGNGTFNYEPNGNDILVTDVAAFDLTVYSPNSGVNLVGGVTVQPDDMGYDATTAISHGGYVNLGHTATPASATTPEWFSGPPATESLLSYPFMFDYRTPREPTTSNFGAPFLPAPFAGLVDIVYDTWTPFYESDGVDQDIDGLVDQGTNGIDDGGPAAPDDDSERETRPPYPYPIRGVKATIRLIEKNTKQVHQSSVIHSYVPE